MAPVSAELPNKPSTPINIQVVKPAHFHKYAKNLPVDYIWYTPNKELEIHINFLSPQPSSLVPQPIPLEPPPIPPDNTFCNPDEEIKKLVPEKYHDYLDVFSPTEVKWLPDHCSYNVEIKLEEGKTPPFGPIYSLSTDECKALFDYIEEHLTKGFIQRSTSSAASPILFIKQKQVIYNSVLIIKVWMPSPRKTITPYLWPMISSTTFKAAISLLS